MALPSHRDRRLDMTDTLTTPTTLRELQALLPVGVHVRLILTPDLARQLLAHTRRVLKNPGDERVAYFVRSLQSGSFDPDRRAPALPEAIGFTRNLQITNGMHRVTAVALAGIQISVDGLRYEFEPWDGPPLPPPEPPAS